MLPLFPKKDQAKYWGWNAWDTVVDASNIVSGVDSLYGNFFSEGKKTKNSISVATNAIACINAAARLGQKSWHVIKNFRDKKFWTLDNALEVSGAIADACLLAAKTGNTLKAAFALVGRSPMWLQIWSKVSYFLTGISQFNSLATTSINLCRKGHAIRKFENNPELIGAKKETVRLINDHRKPGEKELSWEHYAKGRDRELTSRAKELLRRNERTSMMMERGPLTPNARKEGEHDVNEEAPAAAGEGQEKLRLNDADENALVTYVALRGKVDSAELSLLKSVPGLITSATGTLNSFWGGANSLANGDGTNKAMNTTTKVFSTASSAAVVANAGYRIGQRAHDVGKVVNDNPMPDADASNLAANFIWNKFEQIISNNQYGMKGLSQRIQSQEAAENPEIVTQLVNQVQDAESHYLDLEAALKKLYIPIDKLIAAEDMTSFKRLLVASGL